MDTDLLWSTDHSLLNASVLIKSAVYHHCDRQSPEEQNDREPLSRKKRGGIIQITFTLPSKCCNILPKWPVNALIGHSYCRSLWSIASPDVAIAGRCAFIPHSQSGYKKAKFERVRFYEYVLAQFNCRSALSDSTVIYLSQVTPSLGPSSLLYLVIQLFALDRNRIR